MGKGPACIERGKCSGAHDLISIDENQIALGTVPLVTFSTVFVLTRVWIFLG
jgi:hypothetical protein